MHNMDSQEALMPGSSLDPVSLGVPQGSISGLLFFYIHLLLQIIQSTIFLFTALLMTSSFISSLECFISAVNVKESLLIVKLGFGIKAH